LYNVTEYQYQQLKNYYPNCSVVAEIGRQPLKEESPNTDVQQLKAEIAFRVSYIAIDSSIPAVDRLDQIVVLVNEQLLATSYNRIMLEIVQTVKELLQFVRKKYDIKSDDDFTCPIHRKLLKLVAQLQQ